MQFTVIFTIHSILRNLSVNKVDFDSELSGKLNAGITQGINFKIAGKNDSLELVLDETYFPTAFLVKRDQAKLAGVTEGENFLITLAKFPLELLGIAPAKQFDIGAVELRIQNFSFKTFKKMSCFITFFHIFISSKVS